MNSYRSVSCAMAALVASWCGCFLSTEGTPTSGAGGSTSSSGSAGGTGGSTGGTGGGPACEAGTTRSCYTGPVATMSQGTCKAGKQACKSDGTGWGPCTDEVTPEPENCALGMDSDCDSVVTQCTGAPAWSHAFGDVTSDSGYAAAIDLQGNVVIGGYFRGGVDFGGGAVTSVNDTYDAFVAKWNPAGQILWRTPFKGPDDADAVYGVAVDPLGNIAVCGMFGTSLDLGNGKTLTGGAKSAFVAKLNSTGVTQWAKSFGAGDQVCSAIAFDTASDVIVGGSFASSITFGGKTLTTQNMNDQDGFVAKLDGANGNALWALPLTSGNGTESVTAVAADSAKNVIISGTVEDGGQLGTSLLSGNHGGYDALVAKISPAGVVTWAKLYGDDNNYQVAYGVAVSGKAGDIVLAGVYQGPITFTKTLAVPGAEGAFVAKLDTNGTPLWEKGFGDAGYTRALALAVDPFSNIVVAGDFDTGATFGADVLLTSDASGDLFVAKLDGSGKPLWALPFGGDGVDEPWGLAVDALGRAALTGEFATDISFGAKTYTSAGMSGTSDIFIAKLAQ